MLKAYYGKHGIGEDYAVFRSKGFAPEWGVPRQPVSLESLPPILRTMLVSDGTVTKLLEAYYWEAISVRTLSQRRVTAEAELDWLDVRVGDEVIGRRVDLRGSGEKIYAKAFSIIRSSLIPAALLVQLLAGRLGIGELLRSCALETFRELLEIGSTTADNELDAGDAARGAVYRTYRITLSGKPAILVTEHFMLATFAH
jgi:chorismate-pyruvate lyase